MREKQIPVKSLTGEAHTHMYNNTEDNKKGKFIKIVNN